MLGRLFWLRHEHRIKRLLKNGLEVGRGTLIFNEAEDYGCNYRSIKIGCNCVIASGVQFISNHAVTRYLPGLKKTAGDKTVIRDNCFLGIDSIIYPGIVVGPNAIVGAGAVVMEDVPPNMCVSGNPSCVNCTLDLYRFFCRRGIIPNYSHDNKRKVLQEYFWN